MMLEPGCTAGMTISASPVRGPDASSRRSLAILFRSSTQARSAPLKVAMSPMDCMSWIRSSPSWRSSPLMSARCSAMSRGYSGSALMPVPTAVPPILSSRSQPAASVSFSRWRAAVRPYAVNSCPSRIGVASWRWVRPLLTMASNARPRSSSDAARRSIAAVSAGSVASVASRMAVGITSLVLCAMLT